MSLRIPILLSMVILMFTIDAQAQNIPTYTIINDGSVSNMNEYINALNKNNLDRYRHVNFRTILAFKSGVEIQLFSANELIGLGLPVNLSLVSYSEDEEGNNMRHSEFDLHSSGRILELVTPVKKHYKQ